MSTKTPYSNEEDRFISATGPYACRSTEGRKILKERAERDGKRAMELAHLNGERECADLSYSYEEDLIP